jgi:hypothetical protein
MARVDINRLRAGERIAGVSALALFGLMFLNWYAFGDTGVTAWNMYSTIDWVLLLVIVVVLLMTGLTALGRTVALPVALSVIATVLALLALAFVLYRTLLNQPGPDSVIDLRFGAYLGVLATAGIAFGSYLSMADERSSVDGSVPGPAVEPLPPPAAPPGSDT